jgi:transcriptional antiterminator RfaH
MFDETQENSIVNNEAKRWYVLVCRRNWEKKIATSLTENGFTVYLPLKKVLRTWSDRKKWLKEALIPSYLFLYSADEVRKEVFFVDGIKSFLMNHGKLAVVREREIDLLKEFEKFGSLLRTEALDYRSGKEVIIKSGPFKGLNGTLKEKHGKSRFLVHLENFNCSVEIDVNFKNLEYI